VVRADTACSSGSDCAAVNLGSDCYYECPVAVSKSSAPALEAAVRGIAQSVCPASLGDGCPTNPGKKSCSAVLPDGGARVSCGLNHCAINGAP
jgi:hypothetical protein